MKVTVVTLTDEIFTLDVSQDLELKNFKTFCHLETGFPTHEISISFNGKVLKNNKRSLDDYDIHDGDIVVVQHIGGNTRFPPSSSLSIDLIPNDSRICNETPSTSKSYRGNDIIQVSHFPKSDSNKGFVSKYIHDPAHVRDLLLSNPDQLSLLQQNNPRLAEALKTDKLEIFSKVLKEQINEREKRKKHKLKLMNAHPYDVEAQRLIAEEIRQKNVEANMEAAMEYNPETFGSVVMLYINCKVNGIPVKAFVDSGAQTTIMSSKCAEICNIMRLIDTRWAGLAKGVGIQTIIGRIHMVQVAIENDFLTTSFSILEEQPMDMLLGLDMLKRHQCSIDLKRNVLKIGTTGTKTPFLSESELPECAKIMSGSDEEDYDAE